MKINTNLNPKTHNKTTQINFCGQRLVYAKAKEVVDSFSKDVDVCFTKLTSEDTPLMQQILPFWEKSTQFGQNIINSFFNIVTTNSYKNNPLICDEFYMLEKLKEPNPLEKVRALIQVKAFDDEYYVQYIQSANKIPQIKKLKGSGELTIYGLVKRAKEENKEIIDLFSTEDEWYKKMGFTIPESTYFPEETTLVKKDFNKLIKYIENKYNTGN